MKAIVHRRKLGASEGIKGEVKALAEDEESFVIETLDLKSKQVKLSASFRFLNYFEEQTSEALSSAAISGRLVIILNLKDTFFLDNKADV